MVTCRSNVQSMRRRDTDVGNIRVDTKVGSGGGVNLQDSD